VLAVLSCILLAVVGSNVNRLVPFYALGVFTAFTLAGFGMSKYHHVHRERGWRHKRVINFAAGLTSLVVVLVFAVVKFTEGAWLVLIVFAVGVPLLIRLNRQYQMEAEVLEHISTGDRKPAIPASPPTYSRRTVYVFVDEFDLATLAGLRYARSLRPTSLRAVHFVIDSAQATLLREDWLRADTGVVLDLVDCPDRRIAKAAAEMVQAEAQLPGVGVTAVLPRRSYAPLLGRLLHDRTADRIAAVISQIPHAAATIVPFDVRRRVESVAARERAKAAAAEAASAAGDKAGTDTSKQPATSMAGPAAAGAAPPGPKPGEEEPMKAEPAAAGQPDPAQPGGAGGAPERQVDLTAETESGRRSRDSSDREPALGPPTPAEPAAIGQDEASDISRYNRPVPSKAATPIGQLPRRGKAKVEGRVHAVEIRPVERNTVLACEIVDATGQLTALFYGRSHIPGLDPGAKVRFTGQVGMRGNVAVMINPAYELLAPGEDTSPPS